MIQKKCKINRCRQNFYFLSRNIKCSEFRLCTSKQRHPGTLLKCTGHNEPVKLVDTRKREQLAAWFPLSLTEMWRCTGIHPVGVQETWCCWIENTQGSSPLSQWDIPFARIQPNLPWNINDLSSLSMSSLSTSTNTLKKPLDAFYESLVALCWVCIETIFLPFDVSIGAKLEES